MDQPFEIHGATYLGRNELLIAFALTPVGIAFLGLLWAIFTGQAGYGYYTPHLLFVAWVSLRYIANKNPLSRRVKVSVRASREGITLDDTTAQAFLPRSQLKEGFMIRADSGATCVQLTQRGFRSPIDLELGSEDEGHHLLRALGFDASQSLAHFYATSRLFADLNSGIFWLASMGVGIVLISLLDKQGSLEAISQLLFMTTIFALLVPTRVEVGADGVLLKWLWRRRFVGHGDIEQVHGQASLRGGGLVIQLRGGEHVWITRGQLLRGARRAVLMEERIREAMASHKQGGAAADAMLLSRGERQVGAWITMLRSIGAGASAAHRRAPIAPERLFRILESPSVKPSARAAAAVALGAAMDDEGRSRIKAAADATAAPRLRLALQAIADGREDAEIEAALAEIEQAEVEAASRKGGGRLLSRL